MDISDTVDNLKHAFSEKKVPEIQKFLISINKQLSCEGSEKRSKVDFLSKDKVIELFCDILKSPSDPTALALVAEIFAEIAKLDSGRRSCSRLIVIKPLVQLLTHDDSNIVLQVCRALGNICYDNDEARSLVKENDGVKQLIQLLKNLLEKDDLPENMRTITSGCLLNLTDTYEEIQDQAVDAGILDVLLEYLSKFCSDEDVVTHCLLVLSCLADSNNGRSKILEQSVLTKLVSLLEKPLNDDIMDSLLELFGNLCESDPAKLSLAKMRLCEKLVEIVRKHVNSGSVVNGTFNICKTVPDLIILILTGDESMEYLWDKGEGAVYKETLSWLKSSDENLLIAGALAAGNFARKDSHCIQMLEDGVVEQLKYLLEKHSGRNGDIRMQHAVLSALRNLAIPAQNKAAMVELGVVSKLIAMMSVETFPVVFKLLGTLRMLLDKQEKVAIEVGENKEFVERLVQWCGVEDHPGVKGEATRVLAWLAKNSDSSSVVKNLVKTNAFPYVITMLKSEHGVMQNEALVAVTMAAKFCLEDLETISSNTDLMKNLEHILSINNAAPDNKNCQELTEVVLSLLISMKDSDSLKTQIAGSSSLCAELKKLSENKLSENPNAEIQKLAKEVLDAVKK